MKTPKLRFGLLVATILALASGSGLTRGQGPTDQNFAGRVYDLDYLGRQGWTQVLIESTGSHSELVATSKSELIQRTLETALLNETEVRVTYQAGNPAELRTAILRSNAPCSNKGCVEEVVCDVAEDACSAKIIGQSTKVRTKSIRALGILLSAVTKKQAVGELDVDDAGSIMRVKINVP